MPTPKQPADRKPKAKKVPTPALFEFPAVVDGQERTFTLPSAADARANLSGGDIEDALLMGEAGMGAMLVKLLHVSGATPEARAALRAMKVEQYMDTLQAWGEFGDGDGASVGESKP